MLLRKKDKMVVFLLCCYILLDDLHTLSPYEASSSHKSLRFFFGNKTTQTGVATYKKG